MVCLFYQERPGIQAPTDGLFQELRHQGGPGIDNVNTDEGINTKHRLNGICVTREL